MKDLGVIILAAGKGTRMKSSKPKVLFPVAGKPMLFYPLEIARKLRAKKIVVVVGHGREQVMEEFKSFKGIEFAVQKEQIGTGHAVKSAEKYFRKFSGDILILSGDVPLLTLETLRKVLKIHRRSSAMLTLVSAVLENPKGYGRIIRDEQGRPWRIVEEVDATASERAVKEVNGGIYLVGSTLLFSALKKLSRNNRQGEYYLPQIVDAAYVKGEKIEVVTVNDPDEIFGVNSRIEFSEANRKLQKRLIYKFAINGVTFIDPDTTHIDYDVNIMPDAVIYPNTFLTGRTVIRRNAIIEQGVTIVNSVIGENVHVKPYSVIEGSIIYSGAQIGPFAHIRPESIVGRNVKIGNFVELKKTTIGEDSKAAHLTYLGDATVGQGVNIGCGTITCNYDGVKKHRTIIEDGVFIGSDTQLVAPVRIGKQAYIGAGSTITKDVPSGALGIARVRQSIIPGYYRKIIKRKAKGD